MRVAHFIHRYPPALGGSEAFFARLSQRLAEQGDQVRVLTSNALDLEAFWNHKARRLPPRIDQEAGVEVRRYPIRYWWLRRYTLKLFSLIPYPPLQCLTLPCNPILPGMWSDAGRMRDVDLVHASAFPYAWPILCGRRLARRLNVPLVLTPFLHLGDPRDPRDRTRRGYLSPALRSLLRSARLIFVQTEPEKSALLDLGIAESRLVLLGMGVDPADCTGGDRAATRRDWGVEPDLPVIGHLANQSAEKGTVDLVEAARRLWRQGERFRLVLAGPRMPSFRAYAEQLPSGLPLLQLGELTEEQKRGFLAALDLFAMPSRSDSFGIVFLEAWANGVPCVAYRAGGVAGVIRHGRDGLLADCGDVPGLAAHLGRLLRSAGERRALGESGRERVLADHQWPPRLQRVREEYRRLIEENRPS